MISSCPIAHAMPWKDVDRADYLTFATLSEVSEGASCNNVLERGAPNYFSFYVFCYVVWLHFTT